MERSERALPRHRADGLAPPPTAPEPLVLSRWLVVGAGWYVLATTIAMVIVARVRLDSWMAEGTDEDGVYRSAIPNIVIMLLLVVSIGSTWLSGLASTPNAAWRDDDEVAAITMFGVRRVRVPGSFVVPFRILTNVGACHGVLVVDRRLRPLLLIEPFGPGSRGRIDRLLQRVTSPARPTNGRMRPDPASATLAI